MTFDPAQHHLVERRGFEALAIGEIFRLPSRTIGDGNFAAFQALSLDNHPIHYDVEYCRSIGHPAPLAHGLQVLAMTAAGAGLFPHVVGKSIVGFVEVSAKFLKGVYPGDTLYPALEIAAKRPQRTTGLLDMRATIHNQRGDLVLDGVHTYLFKLGRAP